MRLALNALTIFVSASLLFAVEPMAGKALLPRLGGVPGAWTACLLFFQAALLVGYAYVWVGARFLRVRARVVVHLALLGVALVVLVPFAWPEGPSDLSPVEAPETWALAFLALNVGAPFTILSATGPLLQDWLATTTRARPYFLYAASNAGSLGALLAYPFVIEPWLDLEAQASAFRGGLVVVAIGIAIAGAFVLRDAREQSAMPSSAEPIAWKRRARWIGLALVPSMLLAGSTSTLSLDLAPLPLLWVVPLAIYLLSFVLAFSDRVPAPSPWVGRAACLIAVVLVFATATHANEPVWLLASMHVAFLGAASWVAHRRLADDAPDPAHVPEFFAWIALGGVLGTLVSAVLAPLVLSDVLEYPIAIAIACATRELAGIVREDRPWKTDLPHVAAAVGLMFGGAWIAPELGLDEPQLAALASFGPAALYAYRWMPLRRRYTLCLLAIVIAASFTQDRGDRRLTTRSFFGVLRVIDSESERHLLHGTTLHGTQRLDQRDECVPLAYYVREGPLGWAFDAHRARDLTGPIAAVGLGTGSIACYAERGERWHVYEINPDVVRVARDPEWFTYLRESPSDAIDVRLGDGRIGIAEERDASLAMIVLDAFNSDSVPVHLLTREALRLYLGKLEPGGWVLFHLSNRVLSLRDVLADVVAAEGAAARIAVSEHATWAVVARRAEDLDALDHHFAPLAGGDARRAWTDAFSSVWSAVAR